MNADNLQPGVYYDIPNEKYHSMKDAVSNSGLGDLLRSPFHYWSRHLDPDRPAERTKAGQLEGTLAHCSILEPDEFGKRYIVGPSVNKNTKRWKEFAAQSTADGLEAIKVEQYDAAMRQAESVRRLPDVAEALSRGKAETSAVWQDTQTGVLCRCRPDWIYEPGGGAVILDVKTYSDASPNEFARQIARKGYARQDAMYSEGYTLAAQTPVLGFLFLAVESDWPYAASVSMLDDDSKDAGHHEYRRALEVYAECKQANRWPAYSTGVEVVRLPAWKLVA